MNPAHRADSRYRHTLPAILLTLALAVLAFGGGAGHAETQATITVNTRAKMHPLNKFIFGQNVLFAANSLWNTRVNDVDPAVRPLVNELAPTVIRFPGGTASNIYLWEDGLGFRTATETKPFTSTISLNGAPNWKGVLRARIFDKRAGALGEPFTLRKQNGNLLEGVIGLKNLYPPGVIIRPEERPGQPDYFMNNYGIMEHMKFVASMGAQAIITVNYNTGLDKEGRISNKVSLSQKIKRASAWVAFVNGDPANGLPLGTDDEGNDWRTVGYWAQKRVDLGHPAPYGVKYWEVGNEMYDINNPGGCASVQDYARDFVSFARAMKTVDPRIKLGAVGLTQPRGRGDADFKDAWNPTLLRLAAGEMDYLILHPYYPAAGEKPAPYQSQAWYKAVMAGASQVMADLKEIRKVIRENSPPGKKIEMAVTEYGIWPAAAKDPRDWSNLARALFDADLLMGLLRDGPDLGVNLATNWILHGAMPSAAIHYNWSSGTRTVRPHYYAMQLLRNLAPELVATQVASPTFAVTRVGNVMDAAAIPLLGALAGISKDGRYLTLLVISRALGASLTATIRLVDYTPETATQVLQVKGSGMRDHNEDQSRTVTLTTSQLNNAAPQFTYTFEPHSLTLFKFRTTSADSQPPK
jgi:alpha-N-arabinofuranosidase